MRIVVIGAGFGAAIHAPNVRARSDLQLVGICDGGSGGASAAVAPGETVFHDWRVALASRDVGAAIIATPPAAHEEIARAAIERGLHVLVEKPAGLHAESARALARLARAQGVTAAVNFQFRFEPLLHKMQEGIRAGRIGVLRSVEVQWHTGGRASADHKADWRHVAVSGGGVLLSHLSHVLDLVRWLGGGDIVHASGDFGSWVATRRDASGAPMAVDAEDHVVCRFATARGVLGSASVSNAQPGGDGLRVLALGNRGSAVFTHTPPFRSSDQSLVFRGADGDAQVLRGDGAQGDTRARAAAHVLDLFVGAVRAGASPDLPTIDDAAAALAAIERLRPILKRSDDSRREGIPT